MKKNFLLLSALASLAFGSLLFVKPINEKMEVANAAVDINDYSACETAHNNGNASSLLTALRNITAPGQAGSYNGLWTTYNTVYVKDGYIFDYYSSISQYVPGGSAQGANYSKEGDSYNREHSIPKSWWGGDTTNQGADPFIVVPTDGYVNNARGNDPFGMVASASKTFSNAKVGSAVTSWGYSGTVFEPDDSVKGDFARITFYAIAKYSASYGWTSGEGNSCFSGSASTNFGLTNYAVKLFSYWSNLDPVSEWEQSVNDKIANIQGNRNPFIDHPEYANTLWGNVSGYTTYTGSSTPTTGVTISSTSKTLTVGGTDTISATSSSGSTITWSTSNSSICSISSNSASSGASITLTAEAAGSAIITASTTISGTTYSKTCAVTVNEAGGGGDGDATYEQLTSIASIDSTAQYVLGVDGTGFHYSGTSNWGSVALPSAQTPIYYTLTKASGNASFTARASISGTTYYLQVPTTNTFSMATSAGTNTSLIIGTTQVSETNYAVANATTTARHLRINGTSGIRSYAGTTGSMAYFYKVNTPETTKTLSSITLDTSSVTTSFYVNGTFSYSGLVVTAHYDDNSSATVIPTSVSTPDMTTTGSKTVTVTYTENGVSKTATYNITVSTKTITSITASANKDFYVGETITTSDITVTDNYGDNVTGFSFTNNNYQFLYSDAASGGSLTNKTFTNAISYSGKTCSLTVKVARKAYVASTTVSDTLDRSTTSVSGTTYTSWSNKTGTSGVVYAGQSAGGNSSIQLRSDNSNSGIITTSSDKTLNKVTVTWNSNTSSGRTLNVYGKNTAYSDPSNLYASSTQGTLLGTIVMGTSTELTISGSYKYVGVRSASGAMYLTNITFTYVGGDSAKNVANYIMYEDTEGQCATKLNNAISYLNNMSTSEKETFSSSSDYVVSTARTRLNAWAANQGKTITYSNGAYSLNSNRNMSLYNAEHNYIANIVIIISISALLFACAYISLRKIKNKQ